MKLIFCRACHDLIRLFETERACKCGKSKGNYTDDLNAVYSGEYAVPIGFHNGSFRTALMNQPESGRGKVFETFVIAKECETFIKQDK